MIKIETKKDGDDRSQFNVDIAAKITKVTENEYMYSQVIFADEDLCLEALHRKWSLPILRKFSSTAPKGPRS
jgi:hypothetical protein